MCIIKWAYIILLAIGMQQFSKSAIYNGLIKMKIKQIEDYRASECALCDVGSVDNETSVTLCQVC